MNFSNRTSDPLYFNGLLAIFLTCAFAPTLTAQCAPPVDGLVGWWAGDGDATDRAGDHHGSLVGTAFATGFVTTGTGQAFSFDGVDDFVDLSAHTATLNFSPTATFEFWVRPGAEPDNLRAIYAISDGTIPPTQRLVFALGEGFTGTLTDEIITVGRIDGIRSYIAGYTTSVRSEVFDGNFHHVALTFGRNRTTRIYLDGARKPVTIGFGLGLGDYGAIPHAAKTTIGAQDLGGPTDFFDGLIDEFKIYNRALADGEILAIFNGGSEGTCEATEVSVDVKPGDDQNCVNINGHGLIPVAVLGQTDFDVADIDPNTLTFGGLEVRVRGNNDPQCSIKDANGDGFLDLLCHFSDDPNQWMQGVASAALRGRLFTGHVIEGEDTICIVP